MREKKINRKYNVVSLFSGCGGLDLGFRGGFTVNGEKYSKRNFQLLWANDFDERACITYSKNFGNREAAMANKTAVTAYVERGGNIRFDVKDSNENEPDMVRTHVDAGSVLMTDTAIVYNIEGKEYADHQTVDHSKDEYVRGIAHTNTIEGAFSHFDRTVIGTYHNITRKHMQAYCDEVAYRYNNRKITDKMRFDLSLKGTEGCKLNYATLVAK